jgi:hypothetical protein
MSVFYAANFLVYIYLKVGWIKRLFSNLDGDWQKLLLFNLQSYGGERILNFQKEKNDCIHKTFINKPNIFTMNYSF